MQADLKHKRKAAGFIRTNSSKALPTFKLPNKSESSDDFSSFENSPYPQYPQQQDSQFSPYKNPIPTSPHLNRPPLPHPPARNTKKQAQPELFTNQKLKRNYQTNNYIESPGQILDRSKSRSNRQEQIREALRKRVEVQKQLAQIDKICHQIDQFRPHVSKEKQGKMLKQFGGKSVEKNNKQQNREKPSYSLQKQQFKYQIDYKSSKSPKYAHNSENQNILNKERSPKLPTNEKIKQNSSHKYNFQQSSGSSNSSSSAEQQQYSTFQCEQTFKPNANQQILTSIEQYKKLHPDFEGIRSKQNQEKNSDKKSYIKSGELPTKNKTNHADYDQDRIRNEHEKARRKFISNNELSDVHQEYSEEQIEEHEEQRSQQEQEQEERLIQQYPTEQFKKTTLKQTIQTQRNLANQSPTFVKDNSKHLKSLQNNSGIHKAKGGICFDLDINQFTQHEAKTTIQPKQTAYPVGRKPKKANTKEEILKRRQMAKNYDKEARARVFAGY